MSTTAKKPRALRDELRSVFQKAKVPTNPTIAVQILRLADDPASSAEQFAEVIEADVALTARLLKMANASEFGQRGTVTSIKRSVTLLGLRRIRMVALGFQMVAHLDKLGSSPFDLATFWQHSLLRGCLAREVASRIVPAYADEAFVIGLLQDCGILLLVQVLGKSYAGLCANAMLSPTAFYRAEKEQFPYDHAETIYTMAIEWKLPDLIAEPLGRHHTPTRLGPSAPDVDRLAAVGYFVGSLRLTCGQTQAASEPALAAYAALELGLDDAAIQACLDGAGRAYAEVATLLPERTPGALDITDLLDQANIHLSAAATDAEQRAASVAAERDRIHREQLQLKSALGQYRDRAAHDPLTRLLNRGALMDATLACLRECRDRNLALAVYFIDVDDFKQVNDDYGHHVGDEVLRLLAGVISGAMVNGGFAGRYGGEEFIVVIPALGEDDARQRARVLIERVRRTHLAGQSPPRRVTCSIGTVWGHPRAGCSPADLFTAADELMYKAKVAGKDRCCFRSLDPPRDVSVLGDAVDLEASGEAAASHAAESDLDHADLRRVAEQLNRSEPTRFATMRKRERHSLLAPCSVLCFGGGTSELREHPGYVRNISTGGVGLITTRPMIRGEPIEIVVEPHSRGGLQLHVGGLIAYCRHVDGGVYDVGVQLVVQGRDPIFRGPDGVTRELDWVMDALKETRRTGDS